MFDIYFIAFYKDIKGFLKEKLFPSFQKVFALPEQSRCIYLYFQRSSNDWYGLKMVRIICMMNKLPIKQKNWTQKNQPNKKQPQTVGSSIFWDLS